MKRLTLKIALLLVLLFVGLGVFAQNQNITNSLKSGNATELAKYFSSSVELVILDDEDSYSKTEAKSKVNSFFTAKSPKGFSVKHEGTAPNGSKFIMGTLNTAKGSFRTYVVIKNKTIAELSFEQ